MDFSIEVVVSIVIGMAILLILSFLITNQSDAALEFIRGAI